MLIRDTLFLMFRLYSYTFLPETETDRCFVNDQVSFSDITPDPRSFNSARRLWDNCISDFAIWDKKLYIALLWVCKMKPPPTSQNGQPYTDTMKGWTTFLETIQSVCKSKWVFMSPRIFFSRVRNLCVLLFPTTAINTCPVSVHK
jgi:hypothetical protein